MADALQKKASLVAASFLALFLELAFIRFLPANVLSLAYFSNIVLISSFLGLGLGALLYGRVRDLFEWFPLALLFAVGGVVLLRQVEVIYDDPGGEWFWAYYYSANTFSDLPFHLNILGTLTVVYVLTTGLFIFIGQKIAALMAAFPPLQAYRLNLLGALLGVLAFGLLAFLGRPLGTPAGWFFVAGAVAVWLAGREYPSVELGLVCLAAATLIVYLVSQDEIWSPYYSIQTKTAGGSYGLFVNRFFHQEALDFDHEATSKTKYLFPYYFKSRPQHVLVLGAGMGNDVAMAVLAGAGQIDAVEIDPEIARLGRELHPSHPYQNPAVSLYVDDARSFLRQHDTKYDMIILGTLDSHALLSAMSTVRLDNFVYTRESLQDVQRHLAAGGVAVLLFSAPTEEFAGHLATLARAAFAGVPQAAYTSDNSLFNLVFIAGPGLDPALVKDEIRLGDQVVYKKLLLPQTWDAATVPTDDWPYLYLVQRTIPAHYGKAIALLAALSLAGIFSIQRGKNLVNWRNANFFALGAAFLLLETKSITTLSLLFGSTWVVNVFVFGSILIMLYLATLVAARVRVRRIGLVYLALGGAYW